MASLHDAGCNYRRYQCRRCNLDWEIFPTNAEDDKDSAHFDRFGTCPDWERMCPRCNTPETFANWGTTPDEYDDPPEPVPVHKPDPVFTGSMARSTK